MQDLAKGLVEAPPLPILSLISELTIGQRATESIDLLADFLHETIFPKLGDFSVEIYFAEKSTGNFLPSRQLQQPLSSQPNVLSVPKTIPNDVSIINQLLANGSPLQLPRQFQPTTETGNKSQLLVPIMDGGNLSALLYLGRNSPCSFPPYFIESIQTLATVIGSRLKSMATIQQLTESMHIQDYSDRQRTVLYEISELAHSSENLIELYAKIHLIVGRLVHARNFFIALVERRADGNFVKFPYYVDVNDSHFQGTERLLNPQQCSITGYLVNQQQPLLLTPDNFDHICREKDIAYVGTRPQSWLGAPFMINNITGAVVIQSYNEVIYTEKDKELMAFVASHIGDALNRKNGVDRLKRAKERAERAEKNKSTFLAHMSHEIRTPMHGIIGLADLVLHSDIAGQQRTYLEMIHSSSERLLKLINDILDFSKIEAGKLELNIAPFNLRNTIAQTMEILAISAAAKNIAFRVNCDEHLPQMLLGDGVKLGQVLINLLANAIKFTDSGYVTLNVNKQGQDAALDQAIHLHFQVQDSGIGIPDNKIDNIFKAFSQLDSPRNLTERGTGLGLVIAGELVEMMGGRIGVESTPGVGTSFYFSIQFSLHQPGLQSSQAEQKDPSIPLNDCDRPLRILLVEDEHINQTLAVQVLEREGWQVEVAGNGIQALEIMKKDSFDLILMDIQMPELDGYETTRAIRMLEKQEKRQIPIIAMTARSLDGDREKCLALGMDGYISKPIFPKSLIVEIGKALHSSIGKSLTERKRADQESPHTP